MRKILIPIVTLIFAAAVSAQGDRQTTGDAKLLAEARDFQTQLLETLRKGDGPGLEKMIGDGFLFIHSTGMLETREEYIKNAAAGNLQAQRAEIESLDETWRVYEGAMVIRYARSVMRNRAANTENRMRYITVYIKTAEKGWQWVSGQSTKLPVRPKAAVIEVKTLEDLVGVYEIDANRTFTVIRENEVFVALTTGRLKTEMIPNSAQSFVLFNENNDPGYMVVTFARDAAGQVSEAILQLNGQEVWRARRKKN